MDNNENISQLLKWSFQTLGIQQQSNNIFSDIIVQTPWSVVIQLSIGNDCYYLKQTPPDLFIEPDVVNAIQQNMPYSPTPTIISRNKDLTCFIMYSCGDHSLRTRFNGTLDPDMLNMGLESYIKIQRTLESKHDALKAVGVPDWSTNKIPSLFGELLEKRDMLIAEGLTPNEVNHLMALKPKIKAICELLASCKIRETLVNCDFNENNMIVDENTQKISIVDWGECVISHPFFSIAAHLASLARRYKIKLSSEPLESIRVKWLNYWSDVANINELNEIYQNIVKILPIFSALGIYRLQAATQNKSKEMQNWFIKGQLQDLLNHFS